MSKKRAKSGTGSAGAGRWESGLLAAPFEEDCWTAFVGLLVPNQVPDREYADTFCSSVKAGHRKLFTLVTYKGLIEEVQELGNPKGKKPKEVPAFSEICETAKVHLDSSEPIPLPLLAKLVKWKLLSIKDEDQKRRETEEKNANGSEDKDKKSGKKSARGKSAKGKGKKTPEMPSPKKESTLKKRGEESQENRYIDDEPDDGPHHYILLYGFLQAPLLALLSDLGISIGCILRLTSEDYGLFDKRRALKEEEEDMPKPQEVIEAEQKAEAAATEEIDKFWSQYEPLLEHASNDSSLHDVARLTYSVRSDIVPQEYEDPNKQAEFGEALFEDVACMVYDLLDQRRQYHNYLVNTKLIHINASCTSNYARPGSVGALDPPCGGTSLTQVQGDEGHVSQGRATAPDMRYYCELMDTVPAECCSVPLIMHCMLEQVVSTGECREPPSVLRNQPRDDGLDNTLAAHLDTIADKFTTGSSRQVKTTTLQNAKMDQFPVFYHHGDMTSERLAHLSVIHGFDYVAAEQSMLKLLPVSMVTKFPRPTTAVIKERSARLHELLYQCSQEGMDPAVMDHTLRKFVFESLQLRSTDEKGRVQQDRPDDQVVWDDPYLNGPQKHNKNKRALPEQGSPLVPPSQDNSRAQTPGILKSRQGSATSVRSSKSQVHFKDKVEAEEIHSGEPRVTESNVSIPDRKQSPTPSLISVQDMADVPQRKLDEWCFVEHLQPNVLLQVLEEARDLCPFIDTYYHRKDHSLLVVMHNPSNSERKNVVLWDAKLHSDVGFRNYLEHVSEYIQDWTDKEEEKYLTDLREKEIAAELEAAKLVSSAATTPTGSRPGSGKGRAQSPKKSRSKSPKGRKSESPAPSAANLDPNSSSFMRPNSLKAWKIEHERELAEEERKKQEKDKKGGRKKSARSRSASPKKEEKEEKGKDKKDIGDKKRSSSGSGRGSRKSEKEKRDEGETIDETEAQQPVEPERYYPFVGYDVGNSMIHVSGSLTSLFPFDGGLVCSEKTEFINGDVFVQATVLKDGHSLTVHIINPMDASDEAEAVGQSMITETGADGQGTAPEEVDPPQNPVSRFGSLTATLSDGMVLSFSSYGRHGAPKIKEPKVQEEIHLPNVIDPSPPPPPVSPKSGRGGSGKKGRKGAPAASIAESEKASLKGSEHPKEEENPPKDPAVSEESDVPLYQQLFVSCPTGLHVTYMLENGLTGAGSMEPEPNQQKLLVKQSYPSKTAGRQPCEAAILHPAMEEKCRYITSTGVVIKLMVDGTTEVLFPTGAVSRGTVPSPTDGNTDLLQRTASSTSTHPGNTKDPIDGHLESSPNTQDTSLEWVTTTITGDQVSTRSCDPPLRERAVLLYSATDPVTQEVMTTREDKVITIQRLDGSCIVDHSDGTRITTYAVNVEYREEQCDSQETGEVAPLEVRSVQHVKVECIGYATVIFNCEDSIATTVIGNGSQVIAIPDGSYEVLHHDGARVTVAEDGGVQFTPSCAEGDDGESTLPAVYSLRHHKKLICELIDRGGNKMSVDLKGEVLSELCSVEEGGVRSEEAPPRQDGDHGEGSGTHVPRYFVVHADGGGCELLRQRDIVGYFETMERDPSTAFIQDPLPDHPEVQGITVMRPYHPGDHSDYWLLGSEESNIVPPNLRPRDFTNLPASELVNPGGSGKFGVRVGRGLAVGSVEEKAKATPAPKCPQFLQLRQFTQYKPLDPEVRQSLEVSLESYKKNAEEQKRIDAKRELKDPRSEDEKRLAGELLAKILAQDENQPDVDSPRGMVVTGESPEQGIPSPVSAKPLTLDDPALSKDLYESSTAPEPVSPPLKPTNKYTEQDWERVRAELDEEQANRQALRRHEVPPYFESQWGENFLAAQKVEELANPDMDRLAKDLAMGTIKGTQPPSDPLPDTPEVTFQGVAASPSGVRPTNPTPGHAIGGGTPTQVRPAAPTPGHASQTEPYSRPGNPIATGNESRNPPSTTPSSYDSYPNHPSTIPEQPEDNNGMAENNGTIQDNNFSDETIPGVFSSDSVIEGDVQTNVSPAKTPASSMLRSSPVKLPAAIQGQRPGAMPNRQFQEVEEPVRRKVTTSSLAGPVRGEAKVSANRGFELVPGEVFFGELREGCTYSMVVHLKNVGVDSCRYKIKQPPPATGLQVIYKPGPVAAGMKAELQIQLYAIAVGVEGETGRGSIGHHVEITTETDFIFLPVSAYILTAHKYDEECRVNGRPYLSPGARLISSRPPSREGIIRPRKDGAMPGLGECVVSR